VPDALEACLKIIFPIFMLAFVSALYAKKKTYAIKKGKKLGMITTAIAVIIIISSAMLISCQFRFGALVIATGSMTGEINKGDMIIYEEYTDQTIKEGQVIVFQQSGNKIVHRVVDIEVIDGQTRYYTKGDANSGNDAGFRIDSDIVGLTDMKIAYVGYPTLWLHELVNPAN
jgi:signal peptidase I